MQNAFNIHPAVKFGFGKVYLCILKDDYGIFHLKQHSLVLVTGSYG